MEDQWEEWENLSKRQLIRPSHACRINITVFARNPGSSEPPAPEVPQVQGSDNATRASPSTPVPREEGTAAPSEPLTNPPRPLDEVIGSDPRVVMRPKESIREVDEWGNKGDNITKEEKQMIVKCHKGMGHPSPERLSTMLRQQGFRSEVAHAALQYKCPVCVQCSQPKNARPATIKDDMDFNDRVAIDGIDWVNSQGQSFHLYHLVDWSTNFHVAFVSPSKTTEACLSGIVQYWLSWAGAPAEMLVDPAAELNSEAFSTFAQQNNIRINTTSPEAHHQNGKAERHGQVLQRMLDKYHVEHPITDYAGLQQALSFCTQAKNASSLPVTRTLSCRLRYRTRGIFPKTTCVP